MMNQHRKCLHTKMEEEQMQMADEMYRCLLELIDKLREMIEQTKSDFCVLINLDTTTFYRYEREYTHMNLYTFISIIIILKQYIREHHIPYSPEIKELLKKIDLFDLE